MANLQTTAFGRGYILAPLTRLNPSEGFYFLTNFRIVPRKSAP